VYNSIFGRRTAMVLFLALLGRADFSTNIHRKRKDTLR
jgi:hypothetical protein